MPARSVLIHSPGGVDACQVSAIIHAPGGVDSYQVSTNTCSRTHTVIQDTYSNKMVK